MIEKTDRTRLHQLVALGGLFGAARWISLGGLDVSLVCFGMGVTAFAEANARLRLTPSDASGPFLLSSVDVVCAVAGFVAIMGAGGIDAGDFSFVTCTAGWASYLALCAVHWVIMIRSQAIPSQERGIAPPARSEAVRLAAVLGIAAFGFAALSLWADWAGEHAWGTAAGLSSALAVLLCAFMIRGANRRRDEVAVA